MEGIAVSQRETLIQNDQVKFIAATYSITDARKEKVSFAGLPDHRPEPVGEGRQHRHHRCRVAAEQQEAVLGVGFDARSADQDKYPGVQLQQYDTYSACIEALKNGAIDAVTTDEVILAGYAAQTPGAFKIVGKPFSEERYGIGLKKDDTELQTKINDAITKMESDGAWKTAFDKNLGPAGIPTPAPPAIDK
jgi:glutamate transport system substrate-binding protein